MKDKIGKYLFDINESIASIEAYLGPRKDFNVFLKNKMLRRAIERELEIIGEAINKIDQIEPEIKISSKKQIIGMRNRVIHGYDKVDNDVVWGVVLRHLPVLKREVEGLLVQNQSEENNLDQGT